MRKLLLAALVCVLALCLCPFAHADDAEVVVITVAQTPSPELVYAAPTPAATAQPELPDYQYAAEDARCISRAIWSGTPKKPTLNTKKAFAEICQNMVDDGRFKDTIRYTLLMKTEFPSYDPDCYRSPENDEIADYVMRSWVHAKQTGDRSYRLTPADGLRYSFYERDGWNYITVYNFDWEVVYDSGGY